MSQNTTIGEQIRAARERLGWSQQRLADELMTATGRPRPGDRIMISRWESAARSPGYYWRPYLERVLGIRFSAPARANASCETHATDDTVASVFELGRIDMERRRFLTASGAYALAVLALPDPEAVMRRSRSAEAGARITVGRGEVTAVEAMTRALGDAAAELGGGHARDLTIRYLTGTVVPWLNGTYTEANGRALFAAASGLVHLAGWMAGDKGNTGLAQQYYAHAYRLGAEAGDSELAATALRGMAVQAIDLGQIPVALRLAEECATYSARVNEPRAAAYYHSTLAQAAALDGDRHAATEALAASEVEIGRAPNQPGQSWASHYSPGR